MKFITIPNNGKSWNEPLRYAFECGTEVPTDVEIKITDAATGETIGCKKLYGVTGGEVDIASYLRGSFDPQPRPMIKTGFAKAAGGMAVAVTAAAIAPGAGSGADDAGQTDASATAPVRKFFRTECDMSRPAVLSRTGQKRSISPDEIDMITLYAERALTAEVEIGQNETTMTFEISIETGGLPCELCVSAIGMLLSTVRIGIELFGDDVKIGHFEYAIAERPAEGRRLMWYNREGGLECHTFAVARTLAAEAEVATVKTGGGVWRRLVEGSHRVLLASDYLTRERYDILHEVLFSPHVWSLDGLAAEPVEIVARKADYPSPAEPAYLEMELSEPWRGGVR